MLNRYGLAAFCVARGLGLTAALTATAGGVVNAAGMGPAGAEGLRFSGKGAANGAGRGLVFPTALNLLA